MSHGAATNNPAPGLLKTRDQRIVESLAGAPQLAGADAAKIRQLQPRARSLPTLLRRHGLLQVLLFLDSKAGEGDEAKGDGELARLLVHGIRAARHAASEASNGERGPSAAKEPREVAQDLASVSLFTYLEQWETAVEVAGWLKMLIDARCPPAASNDSAERSS